MSHAIPIAVIGAGYAGLSCAVELVGRGFAVSVFESSRIPGGRARVVAVGGLALDNGQPLYVVNIGEQPIVRLEVLFEAGTWHEQRSPILFRDAYHQRVLGW